MKSCFYYSPAIATTSRRGWLTAWAKALHLVERTGFDF